MPIASRLAAQCDILVPKSSAVTGIRIRIALDSCKAAIQNNNCHEDSNSKLPIPVTAAICEACINTFIHTCLPHASASLLRQAHGGLRWVEFMHTRNVCLVEQRLVVQECPGPKPLTTPAGVYSQPSWHVFVSVPGTVTKLLRQTRQGLLGVCEPGCR